MAKKKNLQVKLKTVTISGKSTKQQDQKKKSWGAARKKHTAIIKSQ